MSRTDHLGQPESALEDICQDHSKWYLAFVAVSVRLRFRAARASLFQSWLPRLEEIG
jgi:hypothetical protein